MRKGLFEQVLIQIEGSKDGKEVGLMHEETGLALKRRLRKIQAELYAEYNQFQKDITEVGQIENEDERKQELDKLINEDYELKAEKASLLEIEKINSSFPYNFELIELIAL